MRLNLIVFFIALSFMQVSATLVRGQNISLKAKDMPLTQVFEAIEKQSGFGVWYEKKEMPKNATVTVDFNNVPLKDALDQCIKNQPLTYTIVDQMIIIKAKEKSLINRITDYLKQKTVTGKVTDEKGQALPGVNISIKGKNKNTVTDAEGRFSMEADETDVLKFTFLGYTLQEQTVGKRTLIDVQLAEAIGQLDQVQVQGYGTTTQRLATGNIATIKAETIGQQPVTNPLQAVTGRVAGVQVTQLSGIPGSNITVQIRGLNSLGASNAPLYIVDEVPFLGDALASSGSLASINPLNSISPNDIENITILKDADATAIYGSRAANGVVLITTKKGKVGKSKFDLGYNRGFSNITNVPEVMSTSQYLQMRRDAFSNSGTTPTATSAPDLLTWDQNLDNKLLDWYFGNTADLNSVNATFSGGNQQTQFLISGNFHHETNVFSDENKYKRGNLHFSLNHTSPNQKFKIGFSGLYATDNNKVQNSILGNALNVAQSVPNYPFFDANGNYNWLASKNNFYALATAYTKANTQNLNMNVKGSYAITDKLAFVTSIGLSQFTNQSAAIQPSTSKNPTAANTLGQSAFIQTNTSTMLAEPQVTYNSSLAGGKISAIFGSTIQQSNNTVERLSLNNYLTDLLLESRNGGSVTNGTTTKGQYNFLSAFARVNYNYADRYILNGTFRRDGSGRFGPNNRFGNFGSLGAAWIFSNEDYIKNKLSWFSYGKIRASYGTTGSDGIGDFAYLSLYSTLADYGTQKAISPSQIANNDYRWEITKKMEIALDLGFLNDRFLFTTVYYRNRSGNQLVTYPLPATTGFSGYVANLPALVQNSGFEFEVNSTNIQSKNFTWSSSLNLTIPKNKLLSFPDIEKTSYANTLIIGKPLKPYLAYQFASIDPSTGIPSVVDLDGNNTISANSFYNGRGGDKIFAGSPNPDWFAGLNNSFKYKGITLDFFFQYTKQTGYNLLNTFSGMGGFGTMQNGYTAYLDYWKSPNDGSSLPKPFAVSNTALRQYAESTVGFGDASFLRLKTVALRYQVPKNLFKGVQLPIIEVYTQGQNLWTLTDYKGSDPEFAPSGAVGVSTLKSFTFGLKSNF